MGGAGGPGPGAVRHTHHAGALRHAVPLPCTAGLRRGGAHGCSACMHAATTPRFLSRALAATAPAPCPPRTLQTLSAQMVRLKDELFNLRMHAFHRTQEVIWCARPPRRPHPPLPALSSAAGSGRPAWPPTPACPGALMSCDHARPPARPQAAARAAQVAAARPRPATPGLCDSRVAATLGGLAAERGHAPAAQPRATAARAAAGDGAAGRPAPAAPPAAAAAAAAAAGTAAAAGAAASRRSSSSSLPRLRCCRSLAGPEGAATASRATGHPGGAARRPALAAAAAAPASTAAVCTWLAANPLTRVCSGSSSSRPCSRHTTRSSSWSSSPRGRSAIGPAVWLICRRPSSSSSSHRWQQTLARRPAGVCSTRRRKHIERGVGHAAQSARAAAGAPRRGRCRASSRAAGGRGRRPCGGWRGCTRRQRRSQRSRRSSSSSSSHRTVA